MVDLMEGLIECESEPGKGTNFTVKLDIQTSDISEEQMSLPSLEVLVIDDDEILLETAKDTLTALGTNADVAESGEKALQKISEKKSAASSYNVIILDWKMPCMSGLVAEDMDVNWEIISTLLGMYGIKTTRAENGQIAVEMLSNIEPVQYDAVFMDIQMPVMNGLEATRQIRKLKNPYAAGLPIIAMTADAFSENVAECLEAGMNDHISKPIDIKLVIKELRKIRQAQPDFYSEN